jgi:hypothetical protein
MTLWQVWKGSTSTRRFTTSRFARLRRASSFGRAHGNVRSPNTLAECLVGLPIWIGPEPHLEQVDAAISSVARR